VIGLLTSKTAFFPVVRGIKRGISGCVKCILLPKYKILFSQRSIIDLINHRDQEESKRVLYLD
jgi:hypothetical protein